MASIRDRILLEVRPLYMQSYMDPSRLVWKQRGVKPLHSPARISLSTCCLELDGGRMLPPLYADRRVVRLMVSQTFRGVLQVSVVPLHLQGGPCHFQDIFMPSLPFHFELIQNLQTSTRNMAVNQPSYIQAKRASISLLIQPINKIPSAMTAQTLALEKLGRSVNLEVFQELLDLDTPSEIFSRDVVSEFLVVAPETLSTMRDSL
jgi:hypothetical protein